MLISMKAAAFEIVQGHDIYSAYRNGIAEDVAISSGKYVEVITVDMRKVGPLKLESRRIDFNAMLPNAIYLSDFGERPEFTATLNLSSVGGEAKVLSDGSWLARYREEIFRQHFEIEVITVRTEADLRQHVQSVKPVILNVFSLVNDFGRVLSYKGIEAKALSYNKNAIGICSRQSKARFSIGPSEADWANALLRGEIHFSSCASAAAFEDRQYQENAGGFDVIKLD